MTVKTVSEPANPLQALERDRFQIAVVQAAATMERPEFNGRLQRAMDLVLTDSVAIHEDGTATVKSGSHTYEIAPDCTCQDSQQRSRYCKHYLAVELLKRTYLWLNTPHSASNGHQPEPQPQPQAVESAA